MTGRWLSFADAEVELQPGGTFAARSLVAGPVAVYQGRWAVGRGVVVTAVTAGRG